MTNSDQTAEFPPPGARATRRDAPTPPSRTRRDSPSTRRDSPTEASSATRRDTAGPYVGAPATDQGSDHDSIIKLPPELADRFRTIEDLEGGGEAHVVLAQEQSTGARRVIKIYRSDIDLPAETADVLAHADPRFVLPAERGQHLWRNGRKVVWETMDYLSHGSLQQYMNQHQQRIDQATVRTVVAQLTEALDYVHRQLGLVHRDVKPGNVLIRDISPLTVVLADLGLAAESTQRKSSRGDSTVKGTLGYQAPETLNRGNAKPPRDWWALGMMTAELLTGQHPFADAQGVMFSDAAVRDVVTLGRIDLSAVTDPRWNLLCRGLLVHDPDLRWGAGEVKSWLAGATPSVAAPRQPANHIAPTTFAGREYSDPAQLARAMLINWDAGTQVFLDKGLREELAD
jgi:serine/threonine protein kinase